MATRKSLENQIKMLWVLFCVQTVLLGAIIVFPPQPTPARPPDRCHPDIDYYVLPSNAHVDWWSLTITHSQQHGYGVFAFNRTDRCPDPYWVVVRIYYHSERTFNGTHSDPYLRFEPGDALNFTYSYTVRDEIWNNMSVGDFRLIIIRFEIPTEYGHLHHYDWMIYFVKTEG